jgi:hypothetical protein
LVRLPNVSGSERRPFESRLMRFNDIIFPISLGSDTNLSMHVCMYVVCVCVRGKDVCMCVCVCVKRSIQFNDIMFPICLGSDTNLSMYVCMCACGV